MRFRKSLFSSTNASHSLGVAVGTSSGRLKMAFGVVLYGSVNAVCSKRTSNRKSILTRQKNTSHPVAQIHIAIGGVMLNEQHVREDAKRELNRM